jgi:hypothetical protein
VELPYVILSFLASNQLVEVHPILDHAEGQAIGFRDAVDGFAATSAPAPGMF